jgi:hypothetical protein
VAEATLSTDVQLSPDTAASCDRLPAATYEGGRHQNVTWRGFRDSVSVMSLNVLSGG